MANVDPFLDSQIRAAVERGDIDVDDFIAVWSVAPIRARSEMERIARRRKDFKNLQPLLREMWTNGKFEHQDYLWLRQFQSWEEEGNVPESELKKLREAILLWPQDSKFEHSRVSALLSCLRIARDPELDELATKIGLKQPERNHQRD